MEAWFESMGASRVDPGSAVIETSSLGNPGEGTRIGGYQVVTADELVQLASYARGKEARPTISDEESGRETS
jgi:hypothetical protein